MLELWGIQSTTSLLPGPFWPGGSYLWVEYNCLTFKSRANKWLMQNWIVRKKTLWPFHHHHVTSPAWISLILSHHSSLSSIAPGRLQGYILYRYGAVVLAGHPAFAGLCEGIHRSTSLMSSSLLHQCHTCLVRLTWMVFVMSCRWPYSSVLRGCCLQDLFNIARSILVQLPSSFSSIHLVSVHVVHPYSSIDTTADWKKLRFILSVKSDCHMTDSLPIALR